MKYKLHLFAVCWVCPRIIHWRSFTYIFCWKCPYGSYGHTTHWRQETSVNQGMHNFNYWSIEEKDSKKFCHPTGSEGEKFPDSFCKVCVSYVYILYLLWQRFFFKSQVIAANKFDIRKCDDFVWVTKDELLEYFPEQAEFLTRWSSDDVSFCSNFRLGLLETDFMSRQSDCNFSVCHSSSIAEFWT